MTDWPVAQIPTGHRGDLLALGRPARLIDRFPDVGDVNILIDGTYIYLAASDVHTCLELDETPHPLHQPAGFHQGRAWYHLNDAIALAEDVPTHQTAAFLGWLRDRLPLLVSDDVLDAAVGLEDFLDAFTVAQAARILDRDPAVSIGQKTLFRHLEHIGWARRDHAGTWQPNGHATRNGWLTIRTIALHRGRTTDVYPQLYVTPDGLTQLRRSLRAMNPPPPPVAQTTLFD